MHITNLPRESAFVRTLLGASANWDQNAELQAALIDSLRLHTFYYLSANGAKPDQPQRFPRPGEVVPEPETISLAEFNDLLRE